VKNQMYAQYVAARQAIHALAMLPPTWLSALRAAVTAMRLWTIFNSGPDYTSHAANQDRIPGAS
jgi:hypothetical protein